MSADKSDVDHFWSEADDDYYAVVVSADVEDKPVIADVVDAVEGGFDVCKTGPLTGSDDSDPFGNGDS